MKKFIMATVLANLAMPSMAMADVEVSKATAFEQITVSSTAIGLTSSNYDLTNADFTARTHKVSCTVESNAIRFRTDGTNPTASVGYPVSSGSQIIIEGPNDIANFKAIRQTNDATLSCIYWR